MSRDELTFYVRSKGRVQGPYSVRKLQSLRTRGQFSRAFEVSVDRHLWLRPDDVPELGPLPDAGIELLEGVDPSGGVDDLTAAIADVDDLDPDFPVTRKSISPSTWLIIAIVLVPAIAITAAFISDKLEERAQKQKNAEAPGSPQ